MTCVFQLLAFFSAVVACDVCHFLAPHLSCSWGCRASSNKPPAALSMGAHPCKLSSKLGDALSDYVWAPTCRRSYYGCEFFGCPGRFISLSLWAEFHYADQWSYAIFGRGMNMFIWAEGRAHIISRTRRIVTKYHYPPTDNQEFQQVDNQDWHKFDYTPDTFHHQHQSHQYQYHQYHHLSPPSCSYETSPPTKLKTIPQIITWHPMHCSSRHVRL